MAANLLADAGPLAEYVRPWLSTGFLGVIVFLLARFGQPLASTWVELTKLRMQAKVEDRQGFGALIDELREEIGLLRDENKQLRSEVRTLHGIIDGLRRAELSRNLHEQVEEVKAHPESLTPEMRRAVEKLDEIDRERIGDDAA